MVKDNNSTHGAMILVVEDSPTQVMTVQSLLMNAGLRVLCATNGKEGVLLAKQVHPSLILLDVQMPDLNGFEVCDFLKEDNDTARIPIIMLARNDSPDSMRSGLVHGAVDYIPKDAFASATLLETLHQMGFIEESALLSQ